MAKYQLTPVQLIDEAVAASAKNGMVIISAVSDGALIRLAFQPSMAPALAASLQSAWIDAVDQRSGAAEIVPFPSHLVRRA